MAIKAPYNFVPIDKKVYYAKWANEISQDIPFADGEDAVIELNITNSTPLFIGSNQVEEGENRYSSHVLTADGKKHYFIPGTTLKGCFRSAMETLSFAKLSQYDNASFGMARVFNKRDTTSKRYSEATRNVYCGWLQLDTTNGKESYVIYPCAQGVQVIHHEEIKKHFPNFNEGRDHQTAQIKQLSMLGDGEPYPIIHVNNNDISYTINGEVRSVPAGKYRVVCTGYMYKKSHEYLFSEEQDEKFQVKQSVFEAFDTVHQRTEYYGGHGKEEGFLKKRLQNGEKIPVFFTKNGKEISAIGITRMFRPPFQNDIKQAVRNCLQEPYCEDKLDIPAAIFGYISKDGESQLKGRVTIGHAFCQNRVEDKDLVRKQGVLGQPSASYYPLYLSQSGPNFVNWDSRNIRIAGRKRYRIAKNDTNLQLPTNDNNTNVGTSFFALPAGNTFTCSIAVHNLRKVEIGALLSAITINKTQGTFHNVGLAKSFGLGKISCDVKLNGFQYSIEEYITAFEAALLDDKIDLFDNYSLNQFAAIASEHEDSEMQMMNLGEYGNAKLSFARLVEDNRKKLNHIITKESWSELKEKNDEERRLSEECERQQKSIDEALLSSEDLINRGMAIDARNKLEQIQKQYGDLNYRTEEVDALLKRCDNILNERGKLSLSEYLQGKTTSLGSILKNTNKWSNYGNAITNSEIEILCTLINELPQKQRKNLKKDITKAFGGSIAERIINKLGQ